jgi:hypothetical protein
VYVQQIHHVLPNLGADAALARVEDQTALFSVNKLYINNYPDTELVAVLALTKPCLSNISTIKTMCGFLKKNFNRKVLRYFM